MKSDDLRALWRREKFEWGRTDCIMSVCSYVQSVTGVDPAAPWRGTYHDEASARAILADGGGVLRMMQDGFAWAGLDFGPAAPMRPVVCSVAGEHVAGVCMGDRVAFMAAGRGMIEMRAPILGAWIV